MLMKMFYDTIKVSKEIIHFQKFMQTTHKKIHLLQGKSANKIVQELAVSISKRAQVVCMDEFEIKDITDAMIIMLLFRYLLKNGVFIFLTTNTIPDNLYKDGMQRESFLPFIDMIKKKFHILHLDTVTDYRYEAMSDIKNRILYPASAETEALLKKIKKDICAEEELSEVNLESFGRKLSFLEGHKNTLVTNFVELFERPIGYGDYVILTEHFKIIVIESVRKIHEDETDIVTRFINFIDNAYFNKIILFMEIECLPEEIYPYNKKKGEFVRTISRLVEMNSDEYLQGK
jgi:cell division protein ZapE